MFRSVRFSPYMFAGLSTWQRIALHCVDDHETDDHIDACLGGTGPYLGIERLLWRK